MSVRGLLLAAGAGVRFGGPKALVGDWLTDAIDALDQGGCENVTVVLGAHADRVLPLLPPDVNSCVATDWADGMGASLRAGLASLRQSPTGAEAALVHLVDLPDVGSEVVARVLSSGTGPFQLARATYAGSPGHPVLLGAAHWDRIARVAVGDEGARQYLARHSVVQVECWDLATGLDVDERPGRGGSGA